MESPNSALSQLKSNWMVIVFIGSLIATWTLFSARLTGAEEDIIDLKEVMHDIGEIKTDIAVIQSQLIEQGKKDSITSGKIDASNGKLDYIINAVTDDKKR